jgi:hypothetical protein
MIFHTILGNSPFRSRTRRSLHYTDWSAGGSHPATITERHLAYFERLERVEVHDVWGSGEVLFARKFSEANPRLLDRIDEMIARADRSAGLMAGHSS